MFFARLPLNILEIVLAADRDCTTCIRLARSVQHGLLSFRCLSRTCRDLGNAVSVRAFAVLAVLRTDSLAAVRRTLLLFVRQTEITAVFLQQQERPLLDALVPALAFVGVSLRMVDLTASALTDASVKLLAECPLEDVRLSSAGGSRTPPSSPSRSAEASGAST